MSDQLVGFIRNMERRLAHLERLELHNHRVAFLYFNTQDDTDATGNSGVATIDFDEKVYDLGSNFAADTFTAPTDGKYFLTSTVRVGDLDANMDTGRIQVRTSNRIYRGTYLSPAACQTVSHYISFTVTAVADMDAADTATVEVIINNGAGDTADISGDATLLVTYFAGFRVT